MTREEALKLALSSTTSIPEAIKQAEDIMAYLSGENPSMTRNQSELLLHGAREALMEYCGETGSMR